MKWLVRLAIIGAIVLAGLYFMGESMASGLITSTVSDGYFSDVTQDVTIGEILDGICDDGEWIHEVPEEEFAVANRVRYRGILDGQPLELVFVVFSGNPRLDYCRFGDAMINRSDSLYSPQGESEIDAVPFFLYQIYLER